MNLTLKVWRQKDARSTGALVEYTARDIVPDMSFLEMLDVVNEGLIARGEAPIAFDSDCREGICGTCALVINGIAHGGKRGTTVCQLHMRNFEDGQTIVIEPWRARPFPVLKDLITDRSPFDRIIQAGGFISVNTGGTPDANSIPVPKTQSERSMDAAACIGCGACVAMCPNAAAALFTGAKIAHLGLLPQGQPERERRAVAMVAQSQQELFGSCTNIGECEAVCPKGIKLENIAFMNRDFLRANWRGRGALAEQG